MSNSEHDFKDVIEGRVSLVEFMAEDFWQRLLVKMETWNEEQTKLMLEGTGEEGGFPGLGHYFLGMTWTPVEIKRPEAGLEVDVTDGEVVGLGGMFSSFNPDDQETKMRWIFPSAHPKPITHWQYRPEPPGKQETEDAD